MQTMPSFDDFDNIPTLVIPPETMREVIYGEGHQPVGPDRPTRDLRPLQREIAHDELSDGVPVAIGVAHEDTQPALAA